MLTTMDHNDLKKNVKEWEKNIKALRLRADRVEEHERGEFDRQIHLLKTKLDLLKEKSQYVKKNDQINKRTESSIQKTVKEMEHAFISALTKTNS